MNIDNFTELLQSRATHRKFLDESVPEQDIKNIISTARYCPSGHNLQPWKIIAVSDKQLLDTLKNEIEGNLQKIAESLPEEISNKLEKYKFFIEHFTEAPTVLIVLGRDYDYFTSDIETKHNVPLPESKLFNMSLLGIGAFVENILLAAQLYGYGTCWMTEPVVYAQQKLEQALRVEDPYHIVSFIAIGKPTKERKPAPKKEVDDILSFK